MVVLHSPTPHFLETPRLILRTWQPNDFAPFQALNADALVMAHFPATLSASQSDALATRIQQSIRERGWGFWALELKQSGEFIGFCGLNEPQWSAHFTPCVEIGWRLARPFWHHGYAREAARAALLYGFKQLALQEIVSFTVPANLRSQNVMQAIGMQHNPADDFMHPQLPSDHPLALHILYRLSAKDRRTQSAGSN